MCGIAGIISRTSLTPAQTDKVELVNSLLAHRGPDGKGSYENKHVKLAMRRLSIIDLKTGWQPLYNEDRSLVLVANGEIYNFVELRRDLEERGHVFSTASDCETILHLYEEYGAQFVDRLRGMYAFALWDNRKRRLILGRDRMGEKPLYLAAVGDSLFFASEMRALVQGGVVPFKLDPAAVDLYYHYGYVPEPTCMVAGVRKLPAAHVLTIDLDTWSQRERCYWRMEDAPPLEGNPALLIREELEKVAQLITRADVPIGIALSGGVDASAIAALATRARSGDVHAFTVGYKGTPWQDERSNAKAFADYLKIPFHTVELSTADFIEQYALVNLRRDDPIADTAGVAIAAVAQLAQRHSVPVLLFGHGGDELFWGYDWMRRALHATRRREALMAGLRGFKDYIRFSAPPLSVTLGLRWAMSGAGILTEWRQFQADRHARPGRVVFYDSEPFFLSATRMLDDSFYTKRFAEEVGRPDLMRDFFPQRSDSPPEATLIRLICETYLMENGIAQGDRLSMAASVESRLPLVDYRLVETVIGLHKTYPLPRDARPKQWFREAMSGIVPDFVLNRRKSGFSPPWRQWGHALAVTHGDQLINGYLVQNGIIRPEIAEQQRRDLTPRLSGPRPMAGLSLALENWCRQMSASSVLYGDFEPRDRKRATDVAIRPKLVVEDSAPVPEYADESRAQAPSTDAEIGKEALAGSMWMIAATGGAKVLGFACQLALAWFLTREEFGVFAIAVSVSVILSILRDGGLQMVLVEKGRQFDAFAGPVFWMMLTINAATGLLIAAVARPAAQFYHLPELQSVIRLFALSVPLGALPAVLTLRLNVNMKFRELGLIQVASAMIRSALMLFFARAGYGARSFVLPLLITSLSDTLMLWMLTRFSPWLRRPQINLWPALFRSGRWVLLGTFAIAVGNNGAYFVLGKFLPSVVLGTYFFAYQIVMQLGMLISENFYQVLFAAFVRMGIDLPRIRATVPSALCVVVLVGSVASLFIAAIFEPLERALWHGKWAAAAPAVYIFAVIWPLSAGVSVLRALQAARGRFHKWGILTLASSFASVSGTIIGAYVGRSAASAAMGFAIGTAFGTALNARYALSGTGIGAMDSVVSALRPWLILGCSAACARLLGEIVENTWLRLFVSAVCFGVFGFFGLGLFARDSFRLVVNSLRKVVRGRFLGSPSIQVESV
jgi:asparagine synthase (glutamine-hydrolysing)